MNAALAALLQSRKFWVGMLTIVSLLVSLVLCVMGKVPVSELGTYAMSIASIGMSVIGSIAWIDTSKARLETAKVRLEVAKMESVKKE